MSDIIRNLKRVERSLSNVSSNARSIAKDYPDAKSKLYSLENDIEKLVSEVRKIRKKIESGNMD